LSTYGTYGKYGTYRVEQIPGSKAFSKEQTEVFHNIELKLCRADLKFIGAFNKVSPSIPISGAGWKS
jgi:hypothetical protein